MSNAERCKRWRDKFPEKIKKAREGWNGKNPRRRRGTTTNEKAKRLGLEIPTHCPILGVPLDGKSKNTEAQIDQIIPGAGYTPENIAIISGRANRIKSNATLEELEKIVDYIKARTNKQV